MATLATGGAVTPEERAKDIGNLWVLLCASPWLQVDAHGQTERQIREAEAAAELRGKRAALEEMAAWCEAFGGPPGMDFATSRAAWVAEGRGDAMSCLAAECERRARELGGETCTACGKPFTHVDHDPRCSSCVEAGDGGDHG